MLSHNFKVFKVPDPLKDSRGPTEGSKEITKAIFKEAGHPPYTNVGHYVPHRDTWKYAEAHGEIERSTHYSFDSLDADWLCNYPSMTSEKSLSKAWRTKMLRDHHLALLT